MELPVHFGSIPSPESASVLRDWKILTTSLLASAAARTVFVVPIVGPIEAGTRGADCAHFSNLPGLDTVASRLDQKLQRDP